MTLTLGSVLRDGLKRYDNEVALVEPNGKRWSYSDLKLNIDKWRQRFEALDFNKGTSLAICLPKTCETVAIQLACLQNEIPVVPVDFQSPAERNMEIFKTASCQFIITPAETLEEWSSSEFNFTEKEEFDDPKWCLITTNYEQEVLEENVAYVLFTSGSTGSPKGVQITSANALAFINWAKEKFGEEPGRTYSSIAPFYFDLSVFDLYVSLLTGGKLLLFDAKTIKNPRMLAMVMANENINVIYATPTILRLLLKYGKLEKYNWDGLKYVLFAGEVFPVDALRQLQSVWGNVKWYNLYGPTETNVVTWQKIPAPVPPDRSSPYPIGRICEFAKFILRDEVEVFKRTGKGELLISGMSVMPGYVGNRDVFVDWQEDKWYPTGDWVSVAEDGVITFIERKDGMVKRNGYRIELREIEEAYKKVAGVDDVIAFSLSENDKVWIGLGLTKSKEGDWSAVGLKEFGSQHLPNYMIPDDFLDLKKVPMTSSQKIDYQQLKKLLRDRLFAE